MAHFLIDASLPRPTADVLRASGHVATDVRDIGFGRADDADIAQHAHKHQMVLISIDQDFGNIVNYPPENYFGIVVIEPPADANRALVLSLVECFVKTPNIVDLLPGRLAIVEPGRIRLRPPP